jgi:hypothetical protein
MTKEEFLSRFQTEDTFSDDRVAEAPVPKQPGLATTFGPQGDHPDTVFDDTSLVDEQSAASAIAGTFAGVGVELGAGIGLSHKFKHAAIGRKLLSLGRAAKVAGAGASATGGGILPGVVSFAAGEMVIWGASNYLGQQTRKAFGIQEDISAGEMIAASLFGASVITAGANKLFTLGEGVNDLKAWKDISGTLSNKKAFLSGAALGISETIAGALGGGFNSIFNAWARSGSWGVDQMDQLAKRSLKANDDAIAQIKEELSGTKDPRVRRRMFKRLVELNKSRRNLADFDEKVQQTKEEQAKLDAKKNETNELTPEQLEAEQTRRAEATPKDEAPLPPPTEQPRIPEPEEPSVPKTEEPDEDAAEVIRDKEEITVDEEEAEFTFVPAKAALLEDIKFAEKKLNELNKDNFTTVAPEIGRRLKPQQERLTLDIDSKLKALVRRRQEGGEITPEDIASIQADVYLLRRLNDTVDLVETVGGRALQGVSGVAEKYSKYVTEYSARSYAQRAALIQLQNSLDVLAGSGAKQTRDAVEALTEYTSIPEKFGLTGRMRFGEIEDVRGELDEMEWNDIKTLARDINEKLPEDAPRIKLSGKGVTRESVKDQVAKSYQQQQTASKAKARVRKTIQTLENKLTELRSRHIKVESANHPQAVDKYGKEVVDETAETVVSKAAREAMDNDPDVLRLKAQVKYYKDSIDELDRVEALEKELDELLDIEGRGVISEIDQKILKKYKITPPEVKTKSGELRKKIAESKKRMRDKMRDIRKVEQELETARVLRDYEDSLSKALDVAPRSKLTKFLQTGNTWRKMNLINQLPSVLAGVPTAIYAVIREGAARPAATAARAFAKPDTSLELQLAADEFSSFWGAFFSRNGIRESAKRAFSEGIDPTTGSRTRFADDFSSRLTLEGSIQRASRKAVSRADAEREIDNVASKIFNIANITNVFSLGVRGIGVLDAVTKRQLIQGTLSGQSLRQARLELHGKAGVTEEAIRKRAEEIYNSKWVDDDGLQVLDALGDHEQFVDDINHSILLARKFMDPEDIHKSFSDKIIKGIKEMSGSSEEMELLVSMFMPYISVPIKGAFQGLRLTAPANYVFNKYVYNPYANKIKQVQAKIADNNTAKAQSELALGKAKTESQREIFQGQIKEADDANTKLMERIARLERYNENYTQNMLMNDIVSLGLFFGGFVAGTQGMMTGSLNWMTADQREKNKLQPFTGMGIDYRAAAPMAIPLAIGADLAQYMTLRNRGLLKETQNIPGMLAATVGTLTQEVPLFQGTKSLLTIANGGADAKVKEMTNVLASYFPVPAQLRKTIQGVAIAGGDRTVADLRGGSFVDRALYGALGIKPVNRKTDYFGEDIQGTATVLTTMVSRQLPKYSYKPETEFERILATDTLNQISGPPSTFIGAKMDQFIDDDGMTLRYAFMQEVRTGRFSVGGGRKMTLKEAVNKLISSRAWQKKYRILSQTETGRGYNEGLREIQALMRKYYDAVEEKLSKDKQFMRRFINNADETLEENRKVEPSRRYIPKSLRLDTF